MSISDMIFDGAFASACATVVSNPFDVVRTRMQLQGQMMKAGEYEVLYTNLFQAMGRIAKEEGLLSLQKGFVPGVLMQVVLNGIRIGSYPLVKIYVGDALDNLQDRYHRSGFGTDGGTPGDARLPWSESGLFFVRAIAASLCGCVGMFAASPLIMVKTRLQSEHRTHLWRRVVAPEAGSTSSAAVPKASTGTQFGYAGVVDGLTKIYKKGGVRGLWHGSGIGAQRSMLGSPVQLVSYDYCRGWWSSLLGYPVSDIRMHILAAINASFFVTIFMNPLDVVMTRAYNTRIADKAQQAAGQSTISYNIAKQVLSIYRVEGVRGMYKGSVALFARSAPHNITTFVVLEWVRKMRETYVPNRAYTQGSSVTPVVGGAAAAAKAKSHLYYEEGDYDPEELTITSDMIAFLSDG